MGVARRIIYGVLRIIYDQSSDAELAVTVSFAFGRQSDGSLR